MNGNELLNRQDIIREEFNELHLDTSDPSVFIMYFAWILQIASEFDFITIEERDSIANYITKAIEESIVINEVFEKEQTAIENSMYVVSLYFQSMPNWDAWMELRTISSISDAKEMLLKINSWLNHKLYSFKLKLSMVKLTVMKLRLKNVEDCYQRLVQVIKQLQKFQYTNVELKLKECHSEQYFTSLSSYVFLKENSSSGFNLLERLDEVIDWFCKEVSILDSIDAKKIINHKIIEAKDDELKDYQELNSIDRKYKDMLKKLKKERDDNLDYYFESLHRPGRKRNGCSDEVEIEQEYTRKKRALENEWRKKIAEASKRHKEAIDNKVELLQEDYSLVDIIKEYAIFSLAKAGKISYPETLEQRAELLKTIDLDMAIREFIKENDKLSSTQVSFLER